MEDSLIGTNNTPADVANRSSSVIHYPAEASYFAAACAILFIIVGIAGQLVEKRKWFDLEFFFPVNQTRQLESVAQWEGHIWFLEPPEASSDEGGTIETAPMTPSGFTCCRTSSTFIPPFSFSSNNWRRPKIYFFSPWKPCFFSPFRFRNGNRMTHHSRLVPWPVITFHNLIFIVQQRGNPFAHLLLLLLSLERKQERGASGAYYLWRSFYLKNISKGHQGPSCYDPDRDGRDASVKKISFFFSTSAVRFINTITATTPATTTTIN